MPDRFTYMRQELGGEWEEVVVMLPHDWEIGGHAKPCDACGGRGYHSSRTDYPDQDCSRCCGTGHEITEGDL